jgi:hypothetical protein
MSELPQVHSNVDAFERAKAAAHAPRDSATATTKLIAWILMIVASIGVIAAGAIVDGALGAFIGFVLAVGIIGIGGTAVWMADHSHKKEAAARRAAAAEQLRRKREAEAQGQAQPR